jgi:hypothetical protein
MYSPEARFCAIIAVAFVYFSYIHAITTLTLYSAKLFPPEAVAVAKAGIEGKAG